MADILIGLRLEPTTWKTFFNRFRLYGRIGPRRTSGRQDILAAEGLAVTKFRPI